MDRKAWTTRGSITRNSRLALATLITSAMLLAIAVRPGWAQDDASISGSVFDPLGARVAGAALKLLRDGATVTETKSDAQGDFAFDALTSGRYQIEAVAAGFQARTTSPMFVAGGARLDCRCVAAPRSVGNRGHGDRLGH